MIAATRKRETKLRLVKGLSNYGVITLGTRSPRRDDPTGGYIW